MENELTERTKSNIALIIVVTAMVTVILVIVKNYPVPTLISVAFGNIMVYYFAKK